MLKRSEKIKTAFEGMLIGIVLVLPIITALFCFKTPFSGIVICIWGLALLFAGIVGCTYCP